MSEVTAPATQPVVSPEEKPARRSHDWRSPRVAVARIRDDSLLRNGILIMFTTVVNSAFGYAFWLVAAHLFPPSTVGLSAALISVSTLLSLLASLGASATLVQSLPVQRSAADWSLTFWTSMTLATSASLVAGCIVLLLLPLASREFTVLDSPAYALSFVIGTVAWTAGSILDSTFIAERRAGNMLGRNSLAAAGKVIAVALAALVFAHEVLTLLGAWTAAAMAGAAFGAGLLSHRIGRVSRPSLLAIGQNARRVRARLVGNQIIGIGAQMPGYLLPLVVTVRLSASSNAYFYTTWLVCGVFLIISPAVATSLFAEGVHAPGSMRNHSKKTLIVIMGLLVPCMILFFVIGPAILATFGSAYEQRGTLLMQLIILAAVPDAITNVYVAILRVQHRLAIAAWLNLGMGVGTVITAWLLLPALGISAVGWGWLAMQVAGCFVVMVDLLRGKLASPPPPHDHRTARLA